MAVSGCEIRLSGISASEDLSEYQYHFVSLVDDFSIGPSNGGSYAGILQNDPRLGEGATVTSLGQCKVKAGGVIVVGNEIGPDGDGKASVGGSAGMALSSATEADQIITVLLR